MTYDEIINRVKKIEASKGDDEIAHSLEDSLREDFIKYIAEHSDNHELRTKAAEILKTNDIDFSRWYA